MSEFAEIVAPHDFISEVQADAQRIVAERETEEALELERQRAYAQTQHHIRDQWVKDQILVRGMYGERADEVTKDLRGKQAPAVYIAGITAMRAMQESPHTKVS